MIQYNSDLHILILKKSQATYNTLLIDFKEKGIKKFTTVNSIENLWDCIYKNDGVGFDVCFIDITYIELIKNNSSVFLLYQKYMKKFIIYGAFVNWIETKDGASPINTRCFYFKPIAYETDQSNLLVSNNEDRINNGDIYKLGDSFFVKSNHSLVKIQLTNILCIESERNYLTIYVPEKKYLIRRTLQSIHDLLPNEVFIKINRSTLINVNKIEKVLGNKVFISGMQGHTPLVTGSYKKDILNAIPLL